MSDERLRALDRRTSAGDEEARAALRRARARLGLRGGCGHLRVHPHVDLCWECKPTDRVLVLVGRLKLEHWRPSRELSTHLVRVEPAYLERACRKNICERPEDFSWGLPSCGPCCNVLHRAFGVRCLTADLWRRYEDSQRAALGAPTLADRLDEALAHQRALNAAAGLA